MSSPAFSTDASSVEFVGEGEAVLDLLDFRVSVKTAPEANSTFDFIPPESVHYATEYVRLQSEIDKWKEKASKYKLENKDLKKGVEKQTEQVDKLTKEKSEQCGGFQLGLDQLKRENANLSTTLKKIEAVNELYSEKYKSLKSELEKMKLECSALKSSRENEKKLQFKNNVYWRTLQHMANFLNNCNNQLESCIKKLNGDTIELHSNFPQFLTRNLNEVKKRLENNINTISAQVGLNNLLGNINFIQQSSFQSENANMTSNNLPQSSISTIYQPQVDVAVPSIAPTDPPSLNFSDLSLGTGAGSSYQPSTSPITPVDVDLDLIHGSWTGGQVVHNLL